MKKEFGMATFTGRSGFGITCDVFHSPRRVFALAASDQGAGSRVKLRRSLPPLCVIEHPSGEFNVVAGPRGEIDAFPAVAIALRLGELLRASTDESNDKSIGPTMGFDTNTSCDRDLPELLHLPP